MVPQSRQWTTSWMSAHNTGRRLAEKELSAWTRTREPGSPLLVSRSERHTQEEEEEPHTEGSHVVFTWYSRGLPRRRLRFLTLPKWRPRWRNTRLMSATCSPAIRKWKRQLVLMSNIISYNFIDGIPDRLPHTRNVSPKE